MNEADPCSSLTSGLLIAMCIATLSQKHPYHQLNPVTSKWPTQPSADFFWYVSVKQFLRSNPLAATDGLMPEKPISPALLTALCIFPWHQYYRLDVPGDVAMNVNGKAELIMIKFVIPNKSINWNISWFQFWYRICCSLIIGYRINASPSVASLCISTAVIWEFSYVL